jgi:hypothetical protein
MRDSVRPWSAKACRSFPYYSLLSTAEDCEVIAPQDADAVRSQLGCVTESYNRL